MTQAWRCRQGRQKGAGRKDPEWARADGGNKKPLFLQVSFITPSSLLRVADFATNIHLAQEETEAQREAGKEELAHMHRELGQTEVCLHQAPCRVGSIPHGLLEGPPPPAIVTLPSPQCMTSAQEEQKGRCEEPQLRKQTQPGLSSGL